jgi:hypothetical protein
MPHLSLCAEKHMMCGYQSIFYTHDDVISLSFGAASNGELAPSPPLATEFFLSRSFHHFSNLLVPSHHFLFFGSVVVSDQ